MSNGRIVHLSERVPEVSADEMVRALVPPRQFNEARFETYRPDDEYPSQAEALLAAQRFSGQKVAAAATGGRSFFDRFKPQPAVKPGLYLDGGFGVGKTHLLASIWHAYPGRKYFGTFIEYTALIGALGFSETVRTLRGTKLIAIDEFELDDPGDTMMMSKLLGELVETGTNVAATSNTPPNALGEGRFAAQDFLREITKLADVFQTIRIDGTDYRRRTIAGHAEVTPPSALEREVDARVSAGQIVAHDHFGTLIRHLARVHPSKYVRLVAGIDALALDDVYELTDQADALRFVAFIDRIYDAQVPVTASGTALDEIFGGGMLEGGYRKKYLRCVSRLIASTAAAAESRP
ncbi:cell division protein ZapE [Pseudoclavibacter endophyticus]|uniref:Cell division protein ZapE n=1 Tax=Pseudoclavibacter endophyticus TaxID=1778590 RepID=A0A6H9WTM9_9MICO|nr:cell division protein ZapE [Pseudoclavibacter endophyticus]KAB1650045.1 cell division protein ZapE [Pseudoclavibacter endophyticus]GGA57705.1 cell division protein ZapE [Pseudoclavibacter endophyticus]